MLTRRSKHKRRRHSRQIKTSARAVRAVRPRHSAAPSEKRRSEEAPPQQRRGEGGEQGAEQRAPGEEQAPCRRLGGGARLARGPLVEEVGGVDLAEPVRHASHVGQAQLRAGDVDPLVQRELEDAVLEGRRLGCRLGAASEQRLAAGGGGGRGGGGGGHVGVELVGDAVEGEAGEERLEQRRRPSRQAALDRRQRALGRLGGRRLASG
mmetsp:Transcript_35237/g.106018  ORF Transcript_35237/g.106018 Transcript_35237/m.106018 type:complete len:208 (-) Transcript_35237:375-998(-)